MKNLMYTGFFHEDSWIWFTVCRIVYFIESPDWKPNCCEYKSFSMDTSIYSRILENLPRFLKQSTFKLKSSGLPKQYAY